MKSIIYLIIVINLINAINFYLYYNILKKNIFAGLFVFYLIISVAIAYLLGSKNINVEFILISFLAITLFDYFKNDIKELKKSKLVKTAISIIVFFILFFVVSFKYEDSTTFNNLVRVIASLFVGCYFLYYVVILPERLIKFLLFGIYFFIFGIFRVKYFAYFLLAISTANLIISMVENINVIKEEIQKFKRLLKERIELIQNISSKGAQSENIKEVSELLLKDLKDRFSLEGLVLYLRNMDTLQAIAVVGTFPPTKPHKQVSGLQNIQRIVLSEKITNGLIMECVKNKEKKEIINREDFFDLGIKAAYYLPVTYKERSAGVLGLSCKETEILDKNIEEFWIISNQIGILLRFHSLYEEIVKNALLKEDVRLGVEIQKALLPEKDPSIEGLEIKSFYQAARELGGDYYDYIFTADGKFGACVADVSGKGIGASMVMAIYRVLLRVASREINTPAEIFLKISKFLRGEIPPDMFVTGICAVYDNVNNKLIISNSGHNYPLIFKQQTGAVTELKIRGVAIGSVSQAIFERLLKNEEIDFEQGDVILLYSDGLTEAMNRECNEYGLDRVVRIFKAYARDSVETLVNKLIEDVNKFTGEAIQNDDITLITIKHIA
ncbi:MAG: SpoIIE family protein phosphatase [Candidatus Hydrogenedentota bacterium]